MVDLGRLVSFLDQYLNVSGFSEPTLNGLQVSGPKQVQRVAFAVDGVLHTFEAAAAWKADLMIVHHGLYWGRQWPLRGADYKRIKVLMEGPMALYAAHWPLDAHPEVGHAATLLRQLGAEVALQQPFGFKDGGHWGYHAEISPCTREEFADRLTQVLGKSPRVLPFGPKKLRRIACVTGQGASIPFLREAQILGIHMLISGETTHPSYHFALENQINVALGGHYSTEVPGMHALADVLSRQFPIETHFFDCDTGF